MIFQRVSSAVIRLTGILLLLSSLSEGFCHRVNHSDTLLARDHKEVRSFVHTLVPLKCKVSPMRAVCTV